MLTIPILQLFEWPWDSVASECTDFLGPAGYGFAQVSPASEHSMNSSLHATHYSVVFFQSKATNGY
jgi:hypothetical protein